MNSILYIGFFKLPDGDASASRVINNARALRKAGFDIIFLEENDEFGSCISSSLHYVDGFKVYSTPRPKSITEYANKMLLSSKAMELLQNLKDVKIVILYNYPAVALYRIFRYCKKKNIKIISDCTEWYSGEEYLFPKNYLCKLDSFLRMKLINPCLDGIICISDYLKKYYENKLPTIVIPPLIDIEEQIWHHDLVTMQQNTVNFIYNGNPGKAKDLLLPIIRVMQNKNAKFRIIGISSEDFQNSNNSESLSYDQNRVEFLGRLSHSESIRFLKSSDCLIFLRDKNRVSDAGFSTKFVEAFTCNLFIITTDTSDYKKYIRNNDNGIILERINCIENALSRKTLKKISIHKCIKGNSLNSSFDYNNYVSSLKIWIEKVLK